MGNIEGRRLGGEPGNSAVDHVIESRMAHHAQLHFPSGPQDDDPHTADRPGHRTLATEPDRCKAALAG